MIPTSLADIARLTGFAVSTVSRALRDSSEIPVATRKVIKRAAHRLNYRPNPILASLARTHFAGDNGGGIPLASLHLPVGPDDDMLVQSIIEANREHARKLGYRLAPFLVSTFKDGAHATRVLHARGIQGIVLPSGFRFDMLPGMDWNRFSLVADGEITEDASNPLSSLVSHSAIDHFKSVLRAWNETRQRGYQRIGFVLFDLPTISGQLRRGAAHECLRAMPPGDGNANLILELKVNEISTSKIARWVRRYRPDAVIGFNGFIRWALNQHGFRVPEDIAFCSLHKSSEGGRLRLRDDAESGMKAMRLESMFTAIELLDQQIRHREFGLLPTSRIQVIQSTWLDGDSLPSAKAKN